MAMKVSLTAQPTKQKDGMIADDDPDSADQLRVRGFWPKGVEFKHRAKLSADARTIVKTAYDEWCAAMRELHNLYASSSSTQSRPSFLCIWSCISENMYLSSQRYVCLVPDCISLGWTPVAFVGSRPPIRRWQEVRRTKTLLTIGPQPCGPVVLCSLADTFSL